VGSATIFTNTASPLNIANSRCSVFHAHWSNPSGYLGLSLLTFLNPSFRGNHVIYLAARDNNGNNTGWQAVGTVTAT
jgi:hypothetical protein